MGRDAHSSIENYIAGGATSYMTSGARVNLDGMSGVSGALSRTTNLTTNNNVIRRRQFNVIRSQKYRDRKAIIIDAAKTSGRRAGQNHEVTASAATEDMLEHANMQQQRNTTLRQIRP